MYDSLSSFFWLEIESMRGAGCELLTGCDELVLCRLLHQLLVSKCWPAATALKGDSGGEEAFMNDNIFQKSIFLCQCEIED